MQLRTRPLRPTLPRILCCAALIGFGTATPAAAQLRGHGGPVRALAIASDGATALSGSFDTSAIRWSLTDDTA
jgi:cytochrome c